MPTTRSRPIPAGAPTLMAAASFIGVVAAGGHGWQLAVSALLSTALVGADIYMARSRKSG